MLGLDLVFGTSSTSTRFPAMCLVLMLGGRGLDLCHLEALIYLSFALGLDLVFSTSSTHTWAGPQVLAV